MKNLLLFAFIILSLASCKKEEPFDPENPAESSSASIPNISLGNPAIISDSYQVTFKGKITNVYLSRTYTKEGIKVTDAYVYELVYDKLITQSVIGETPIEFKRISPYTYTFKHSKLYPDEENKVQIADHKYNYREVRY